MNYFGTFGETDKDALLILMPVLDRALHAHKVGNYQEYVSIITSDLAGKISEEGFKKAHREISPTLGTLQSKCFLASLQRGKNPMLLFSAKFSGTEDDVLINATFKNGTEPPLIDWLWIE